MLEFWIITHLWGSQLHCFFKSLSMCMYNTWFCIYANMLYRGFCCWILLSEQKDLDFVKAHKLSLFLSISWFTTRIPFYKHSCSLNSSYWNWIQWTMIKQLLHCGYILNPLFNQTKTNKHHLYNSTDKYQFFSLIETNMIFPYYVL